MTKAVGQNIYSNTAVLSTGSILKDR